MLNYLQGKGECDGMNSDTIVAFPAPVLRPFITRYAGFRANGMPEGLHFGLPSSEVDLIISLGPAIDVAQMPNPSQAPGVFSALVSGLQDGPAILRQGREAFGLHVFIKPLGVRAILGVPSIELASSVVSLSDIWGPRGLDLADKVRGARSWQQRFMILDHLLASSLRPDDGPAEISWAWQRLRQVHGTVPVERLADVTGYSRRHFSERFRDAVGVAPKACARVLRFERACRLIADRRASLAHVALACGYYDQAHLTREWSSLAGCSPGEWIKRELPFLQDYELGGDDNESDDLTSLRQPLIQRPVRSGVPILRTLPER